MGRGDEVASNTGGATAGAEVESEPGRAARGGCGSEAVMARGDESGNEG